jgi:serine/threonine-protein kinase HipA
MKCLSCYKELSEQDTGYHPACSRKLFGKAEPPLLPYTEEQLLALAEQVIRSQIAVTGVQPKLSLDLEKQDKQRSDANTPPRFTIVGLWGGYILKPPTTEYQHLPELEDLTMHLASLAGIDTVPHSLIRLQSGSLAYITRRIDRVGKKKLHMEDMCQLTQRLTEDKYKGSYEQIAKIILQYADNPGLDLIRFFEQVIFSFITGNADMHLKNFSLIKQPGAGYSLAPAYDMIATALVVKDDTEELALNLNGKKRKLTKKDFDTAMTSFRLLDKRAIENIYRKFARNTAVWLPFIPQSFLPAAMQEAYISLIKERAARLEIV